MTVKQEINGFYGLCEMAWSGAKWTLEQVANAGKGDAFMDYLEQVFCDETPTDTQVNDFLWFDWEQIFEDLEIPNPYEEEEEEEEADE